MSNVVSFAAAKEERTPHWEGTAYCVGCQHEWQAVAPVGTMWIECPSCHLPKGTPKHPFGATQGDFFLRCNCGCEALTAYKRKAHFHVKCMGCGADLTHAFYDG
jgi:ribosomal protein S27E